MELLPGIAAFFLFLLFDYNKIRWQRRVLGCLFPLGTLLLAWSTLLCVLHGSGAVFSRLSPLRIFFLAGLLLSLGALVYALFFALPFQSTYLESGGLPLVDRGLYALCRHPGFWFFSLGYLFLWLFCTGRLLFAAFLVFSACNLLYIYVQDRYIFPIYISSYEEYKKSVPFLLPDLSGRRGRR